MSNWSLTSPLLPRLEQAIQHRIDSGKLIFSLVDRTTPARLINAPELRADIQALLNDAYRRGANDADTAAWLHRLIGWLEPPACEMGHCEHAGGVGSFCRCGLARVPGRCPIRRGYRKRAAERERKARARVLAVLIERDEWINAAAIRAALGCDPENMRVGHLLRGMADEGLAEQRGDITRFPGPDYRITDAGRAAAVALSAKV